MQVDRLTAGMRGTYPTSCIINSTSLPSGEHENWLSCQALFPHAKSAIAQRPKAKGSLSEWASLMYNAAWYAWRKGNAVEAVQLSSAVPRGILGSLEYFC